MESGVTTYSEETILVKKEISDNLRVNRFKNKYGINSEAPIKLYEVTIQQNSPIKTITVNFKKK